MKKIFSLFLLVFFFSINTYSQFIHKIKADSVLITNDSCNAELNLENSTKNINGFLYNKGNGRTEFRKGLIRINDTLYIIGNDTLNIAKGISGNYIRNQNTAAQVANAWISNSLNIGSTSFLNTYSLNLYQPTPLATTGSLQATIPNGSELTHSGVQGILKLKTHGTNTNTYFSAGGNISQLIVENSIGTLIGRVINNNGEFGIEGLTGTTNFNVLNNQAASGQQYGVRLKGSSTIVFSPTSGTANYAALGITPTYNQSGTATGNIYGVHYDPGITSVLGTHYAWYNTTGNAYWGNTGSGRKAMRYYEDYATNGEALHITTTGTGSSSFGGFVGVRVQPTHVNSGPTTAFKADLPILTHSSSNNIGLLVTGGSSASAYYRGLDITLTSTGINDNGHFYGGKYNLTADNGHLYGSSMIVSRSGTAASTRNIYGYYADATIPAETLGTGTAYAFYAAAGKSLFADQVLMTGKQNMLRITPSSLSGYTGNVMEITAPMDNLGSDPVLLNLNATALGNQSRGYLLTASNNKGDAFHINNFALGEKSDFVNISSGTFTSFRSTKALLSLGVTNAGWFDGNIPLAAQRINMNITSWSGTNPGNRHVNGIEVKIRAANPSAISTAYYADVAEGLSNYAFYAAAGRNYFADNVLIGTTTDNGSKLQLTGNAYVNGKQSIGTTASNALLHLGGGTATANTAPLKFTSGTNLTTPENGAVEYDGTNYFVTSNATRYALARTLTTTSALNFNNTSPGSSTDLTITIAGAANGDAVFIGVPNEAVSGNGSFSAWVSAANTVTVRFANNDLASAIDPASGTFRVSIIKY